MCDVVGNQLNKGDTVVTTVMQGSGWHKYAVLKITTVEDTSSLAVKLKGLRKWRQNFEVYKV